MDKQPVNSEDAIWEALSAPPANDRRNPEPVETLHFERMDGGETVHCYIEVFGDGGALLVDPHHETIFEFAHDCREKAVAMAVSLGYRPAVD